MKVYEFDSVENAYSGARSWQESWWEWMVATYRDLRHSLGVVARQAMHRYLARAELTGELTEFHAVMAQFIVAMYDTPQFALDYLEMAEAAASSQGERAATSAARVVHDRLQNNGRGEAPSTASMLSGDSAVERWYMFLDSLRAFGGAANSARRELRGPYAA